MLCLKFKYSEKATQVLVLTLLNNVKTKIDISSKFLGPSQKTSTFFHCELYTFPLPSFESLRIAVSIIVPDGKIATDIRVRLRPPTTYSYLKFLGLI